MPHAWIVAQEAGFTLPAGEEIIAWVIGAAVIIGLWVVISRTRKKSYREYWERRRAEEERRRNDPDMAKPEDDA